ncbi:MAG TPA: hypothetical protein VKK79_14215 [Candidatus Lokiarchaeia archaeon]|nr:hypothetical protein [Candidatus Lokiarchaeia archaeon]
MIFIEIIQFSSERLVTLIGNIGISILFLFFAARILSRGEKSFRKVLFAKFFAYVSFGLIFNVIYAPFADSLLQSIGNHAVIFLTTMSLADFVLFSYSLLEKTVTFTRKKAIIAEIVLAGVSSVYFFLPISFKPDFSPIWDISTIFFSLALTQCLFIAAIVYSVQALHTMQIAVVKRRFLWFIIGIACFELVLIPTILRNGQLVTGTVLLVMTALEVALVPGGILIYYGVGKNV